MYGIWVRAVVIASVLELGINLVEIRECSSRACIRKIDVAVKEVLRVELKPISVFPEEAKRFN